MCNAWRRGSGGRRRRTTAGALRDQSHRRIGATMSYDVIAVGLGHNGLVAAAYMAAAGKRVLVLERQAWFGGGVATRELTLPGFRHDQHSLVHTLIQANPLLLQDELGLKARYGLRYVFPDAAT